MWLCMQVEKDEQLKIDAEGQLTGGDQWTGVTTGETGGLVDSAVTGGEVRVLVVGQVYAL